MDLREQFHKEYHDKNKNYVPEERGVELSRFYWREYARWLETKLQNTSSNSDYAKCREDILILLTSGGEIERERIDAILKKHCI